MITRLGGAVFTAAALLTFGLVAPATAAVINGTNGPDDLVGTANADTMRGYAGHDSLRGEGVACGPGTDRVVFRDTTMAIYGAQLTGCEHVVLCARGGTCQPWVPAANEGAVLDNSKQAPGRATSPPLVRGLFL